MTTSVSAGETADMLSKQCKEMSFSQRTMSIGFD